MLFNTLNALDLYAELRVIYFYRVTHSYAVAAGVIALTIVFSAALEVPTGVFSDLVGRRSTIVLGAACMVLGYGLYATRSAYWVLVAGAFFEGAARSCFSGNNNAYLHNLLSEQGREAAFHHYYGRVTSLSSLASIIGVMSGGLVANWSIAAFMWLNLVPKVGGLACALALKESKREKAVETTVYAHLLDALREVRANANLRYLSLSFVFGGAGAAAGELQVAAFGAVWPTWALGLARGVQAGAGVPSYYFAGWIIDRLGVVRVIALSLATSVAGNILTGVIRTAISPLFVMLSLPLYGADDVAQQSLLQEEFTERQRATIASLNSLGNSVYFALILYICGLIASRYGPFVALMATQVFLIPSMVFTIALLRRIRARTRRVP